MKGLRNNLISSTTLILAASMLMPVAYADSDKRDGNRRGAPPEAFEACTGKTEGDACGFSGRRGDAEGSCIIPPRGEETLVCAPDDGPPEHAPPEEEDES